MSTTNETDNMVDQVTADSATGTTTSTSGNASTDNIEVCQEIVEPAPVVKTKLNVTCRFRGCMERFNLKNRSCSEHLLLNIAADSKSKKNLRDKKKNINRKGRGNDKTSSTKHALLKKWRDRNILRIK